MKEKKLIITTSIILGVLVLVLGVSYALFTFSKTSANSKLIVGDIYMHYNETNQIQMENVMPNSTYDGNTYFEFTIDGKNTYDKKDIYYEIMLGLGDDVDGKTIRIKNDLLKFALTRETSDGSFEKLIDGESYSNLNNKRIYVETIPKNTLNEIKHTYRLYMWVSDTTKICGGDLTTDCDYTLDDWKDVFASIKINVYGDFNEKELATDASCFKVSENSDGTLTIEAFYKYNANSATPEYLNTECNTTDVIIPKKINNKAVAFIGENAFYENQLTSVVIPDSVKSIGKSAFRNNQLTSIEIPDSVISIGSMAFNNNKLPNSQAFIYKRTDVNNDGIAEIDKTNIISYGGFEKDVIIPDGVITIDIYSFYGNQLTSVVIPNSVNSIGDSAFSYNQLENITIPDNVITIGSHAFGSISPAGNITIGSNIQYIGSYAFDSNYYANFLIKYININKSCGDIKNIPASSTNTEKYYPWTSKNNLIIYGANNEVCDTF